MCTFYLNIRTFMSEIEVVVVSTYFSSQNFHDLFYYKLMFHFSIYWRKCLIFEMNVHILLLSHLFLIYPLFHGILNETIEKFSHIIEKVNHCESRPRNDALDLF